MYQRPNYFTFPLRFYYFCPRSLASEGILFYMKRRTPLETVGKSLLYRNIIKTLSFLSIVTAVIIKTYITHIIIVPRRQQVSPTVMRWLNFRHCQEEYKSILLDNILTGSYTTDRCYAAQHAIFLFNSSKVKIIIIDKRGQRYTCITLTTGQRSRGGVYHEH